jgi:hypothetical protein
MESFAVLAGPPDKYRDMVVREISVLRATEPTESVESVDTLCLGEKDKRMRAVCPFHNPLMLCMLGAFGDLGVRGFRGFRGQGGCPFITH